MYIKCMYIYKYQIKYKYILYLYILFYYISYIHMTIRFLGFLIDYHKNEHVRSKMIRITANLLV